MAKLIEVEGIGEAYSQKMKELGIVTTEQLLAKAGTPQGRQELAEKTGIAAAMILKWANHVDLFRIKGVASEYSELLEAAGVDTVVELAQRVPANLYAKLIETNQLRHCVRRPPTAAQVASWIEQAKALDRAITY